MLKKKLRIDFLYLWTDNFPIEFPSLPFFMSLLLYSQGDIAFIAVSYRDLLRSISFVVWFAKECRKNCVKWCPDHFIRNFLKSLEFFLAVLGTGSLLNPPPFFC
jgi:hypothetical protein